MKQDWHKDAEGGTYGSVCFLYINILHRAKSDIGRGGRRKAIIWGRRTSRPVKNCQLVGGRERVGMGKGRGDQGLNESFLMGQRTSPLVEGSTGRSEFGPKQLGESGERRRQYGGKDEGVEESSRRKRSGTYTSGGGQAGGLRGGAPTDFISLRNQREIGRFRSRTCQGRPGEGGKTSSGIDGKEKGKRQGWLVRLHEGRVLAITHGPSNLSRLQRKESRNNTKGERDRRGRRDEGEGSSGRAYQKSRENRRRQQSRAML